VFNAALKPQFRRLMRPKYQLRNKAPMAPAAEQAIPGRSSSHGEDGEDRAVEACKNVSTHNNEYYP
jgi:hypothetical protein